MTVNTAPYTIDRCDQIVAFNADFIPDHEDYTQRKPAFFTVSAYHFNLFEKNDPSLLGHSILFSNSRKDPSEPRGAQYCLLVDGGDNEKPLIFCAQDSKEFESYKTVFSTFADCRAGKIISKPDAKPVAAPPVSDKPNLPDLVKKCGFDGPMVNPDALLKQQSDQKTNESEASTAEDDFWVPGGNKVPGSKGDEDDKPADGKEKDKDKDKEKSDRR